VSRRRTRERALYVDVDWQSRPADGQAEPVGIAFEEGRLWWTDAPEDAAKVANADRVRRTAELLAAYMLRIASLLEGHERVEIIGSGAVARALDRRLSRTRDPDSRPSAIVVLSHDEAVLTDALTRVDDLGVLVLASPATRSKDLDLYGDLHRRGLRMLGVPRPRPGDGSDGAELDQEVVADVLSDLDDESAGTWTRTSEDAE
jgi:hypothetical protein